MAALWEENATKHLGIQMCKDEVLMSSVSSSDIGNVSYVTPSIHPSFYIGTDAFSHTRPFNTASGKWYYSRHLLSIIQNYN